jgi:hypothetical protein
VFPSANVVVAAGLTSQTFSRPTNTVTATTSVTITASYNGATATTLLTVNPVSSSAPAASTILVNAGGPAYTDPQGQVWNADNGFNGGYTYATAANIQSTSTAALYQTVRFGSAFSYQFDVPNGSYTVILKFAEPYFSTAGSRRFNVAINGSQVLSNFDVVAQAGAGFTAVDKSFPVTVASGSVSITFNSILDYAIINAIQIAPPTAAPTTTSSILVNAGGSAYTDALGQVWSADTSYTGGYPWSTPSLIRNATSQPLYQTSRFGSAFQYQFTVPNGSYTVTLKFAEPYFLLAGLRIFNVSINGTQVLTNFDTILQAGGALTAVDKSFPVTVTSGTITIAFAAVLDNAIVSAIQIVPSTAPTFTPICVDSGGAAYTDSTGQVWSADTGYTGGYPWFTPATVRNTTEPALYQTVRFGSSFQYLFNVPNGSYTVTLKFAEPFFLSSGSRVFNVAINGNSVLSNFDIVTHAGGSFTAYDQSFPVTVTGGQILIQFTSVVEYALVNAIKITTP